MVQIYRVVKIEGFDVDWIFCQEWSWVWTFFYCHYS